MNKQELGGTEWEGEGWGRDWRLELEVGGAGWSWLAVAKEDGTGPTGNHPWILIGCFGRAVAAAV